MVHWCQDAFLLFFGDKQLNKLNGFLKRNTKKGPCADASSLHSLGAPSLFNESQQIITDKVTNAGSLLREAVVVHTHCCLAEDPEHACRGLQLHSKKRVQGVLSTMQWEITNNRATEQEKK